MYRIMGIDYGSVRIGISISDPLRIISRPFETIQNTNENTVFARLTQIIEEQNVQIVVLGLPVNLHGEDTKKTLEVREFAKNFEEKIGIKINWQDERFSSVEANNELKRMRINPIEGRKIIDQLAASIILRNYMDRVK